MSVCSLKRRLRNAWRARHGIALLIHSGEQAAPVNSQNLDQICWKTSALAHIGRRRGVTAIRDRRMTPRKAPAVIRETRSLPPRAEFLHAAVDEKHLSHLEYSLHIFLVFPDKPLRPFIEFGGVDMLFPLQGGAVGDQRAHRNLGAEEAIVLLVGEFQNALEGADRLASEILRIRPTALFFRRLRRPGGRLSPAGRRRAAGAPR